MSKLWRLTYNFFYPESSSNVGTIVGSVVGTLAFIAVAVAVIIVGVWIVKYTKMGKQELMYTVQLLRCTAICWTSTGQNRNFINVLNELCQSSSCQYRNRDKTSTYTHIWMYQSLCVCVGFQKNLCSGGNLYFSSSKTNDSLLSRVRPHTDADTKAVIYSRRKSPGASQPVAHTVSLTVI